MSQETPMMQQTRTFKVTDLREGLRTIKREVGDNAVILSTSRQPDGTVEMTVALANEPKPEPPTEVPAMNPEHAEFVALTQMVVELKGQISSLASEVRRSDRQTPATPLAAVRKETPSLSAGVLQDIRMAVARINDRGAEDTFARSVALMYEWLTRHGVLHGHVEELLAHAFAASEVWEEEPAMLHELVKREMEARIETTPPLWSSRSEGCEVVVLMGSTGVGKTTTAAKIAAHASVVGGKKVGLICADTFRIGAAYQVETYAELLNIPIRLASSMAELRTALQAFSDFDLVIIDTMGRTPWGGTKHSDKQALALDKIRAVATEMGANPVFHLCLSVCTRVEDMIEAAANCDGVTPDALSFTKLDEARALGAIYSVARASGAPVSHIFDWPIVPENIQAPTAREIVGWVYRGSMEAK